MKISGKINEKLINHFDGNRSAAHTAAGLFAMGALCHHRHFDNGSFPVKPFLLAGRDSVCDLRYHRPFEGIALQ